MADITHYSCGDLQANRDIKADEIVSIQLVNFPCKKHMLELKHAEFEPSRTDKEIVEKLRSIIPLKSENLDLEIIVPAQYAAQSYSVLKSTGTLKKEDWLANGSLKAILEIPAAARPNVIDRLGSITKGTATVEVMQ